jgi:Subtilase family/Bacterial Ig domain/Fervidolysin N-terminal prodomain
MNSTDRFPRLLWVPPVLRLRPALVLVAGLAGLLIAASAHAQAPSESVEGELLVGLRAGVLPGQAQVLYRAHGAVFLDEIPQIRVQRIRVPPPALEAVQQALSHSPEVRFVEKNYVHEPVLEPDDPLYSSQWHLPRILAPEAWEITQGAAGVVIAILDSGVDPYHPDLAWKLVAGYNLYDHNTNTADLYGHGTEVAGAAAAATGNGVGVASVAGESPIMPVRVTDRRGRATSVNLASGLTWSADQGARLMNLSFSGVAGSSTILSAAEYAVNHGGLVVAAAGNCGCIDPTPETPYLLSVSATDEADGLAYFSSTGPSVDLSVPGTNILTTAVGGLYLSESGTSLSSPIVAGVAALMFAANPALTPAQVTGLLETTALDLGVGGYDPAFGSGRVDAYEAVVAAASYTPPPDTTLPIASVTSPAAGSTVSGTAVVGVSALDDVGVVQVDLYVDGVLFASDTSTPYSFAWDTSAESNGSHTLQAVASDAADNTGASEPVVVTVWNAPPDTTPPAAAITSPKDGSTVTKIVNVKVHATDDTQVQQMRLFLDGSLFGTASCTSSACDVQFPWNTKSGPKGWHTLAAEATDAAGNVGASSAVTVRVR